MKTETSLSAPSKETLAAILYCTFSVSVFFAFAGISRLLNLQYDVGYFRGAIDLAILSKTADPIVWLITIAVEAMIASIIALWSAAKERVIFILLCVAELTQIILFFLNERNVAFFLSLLLTVTFVASSAIWNKRLGIQIQPKCGLLTIASLFVLLVVVESLAVAARTIAVFQPNASHPWFLPHAEELQSELSDILFVYSPVLMLMAIFLWIPTLPLILGKHKHTGEKLGEHVFEISPRTSLTLLAVAIAVALFVPLSPYVNNSVLHGVDASFYYTRLNSTASLSNAIGRLGVEARAPYILLLFMIKLLTGWNPFLVAITGPSVTAAFFTFSTYVSVKELTRSWLASTVAALLAASWFHTTVGLFAGIYSNWLAMSFVMLFLCFLNRALSDARRINIVATILTGYVTAFVHVWTWAVLIASVVLGFAIVLINSRIIRPPKCLGSQARTYGGILLLSVIPILALTLVFSGLEGEPYSSLRYIGGGMSLTRLGNVLPVLSYNLYSYVGALLTYPSIPVLGILGWIYFTAKHRSNIRFTLTGFLVVTSVGTVLLDSWLQWRMLYVIPFEIFAGFGLIALLVAMERAAVLVGLGSNSSRLVRLMSFLLVSLIMIDSVNYAIANAALLPFG